MGEKKTAVVRGWPAAASNDSLHAFAAAFWARSRKVKKLLYMVRLMMEDTLRYFVLDSVEDRAHASIFGPVLRPLSW